MVELKNLTKIKVSEGLLLKVADAVLVSEDKKDKDLAVALVDSPVIQYLNKNYRKQNTITDVLAFSQADVKTQEPLPAAPSDYLGDIAICLNQVEKNAKDYKTPFIQELSRVLIHGILHLLGYEHENNPEKAKIMHDKEDAYLAQFFK